MPPKTKYEFVVYDLCGNCFRNIGEAILDVGKAVGEGIYTSTVDIASVTEWSDTVHLNPVLGTAKLERIVFAERWSDRLKMKRRGRNKCRRI